MNEINVNQTSNPQTVDSSASISSKGGSNEQFFENSFMQEIMGLFQASGLSEVFQPSVLSEAIKDPHNAKTLEDYQVTFQNHSLENSDFSNTFQNFCTEQLLRKGEFKPIEAFSDWNSYVGEQATLEKEVKKLVDDMKRMTNDQVQQKETVELELQRDPFASLNMIIDILMDLLVCSQKIAATYSASLDTETLRQKKLIEQQSKSLQPISVTDLPEDLQDDEDFVKMVENYNSYTLPAAQDLNRSYRDNSQDIAESLNSTISMWIQNASKLADDISEIMNKLNSMVMNLK